MTCPARLASPGRSATVGRSPPHVKGEGRLAVRGRNVLDLDQAIVVVVGVLVRDAAIGRIGQGEVARLVVLLCLVGQRGHAIGLVV